MEAAPKPSAANAAAPAAPSTLRHTRPLGAGSKRKRPSSTDDLTTRLSEFQHSPTYLRLPASSVAAACGLHPFADLPQLLFDLVYQSHLGQVLLQRDASVLGLTLVDAKTHERESMLQMAAAASAEAKELVQRALDVSEGKKKLQSVEEVQSLQTKLKSHATKAQESGKLSKKQVDSLVEATRGHVSTGFGTCHEDEALDVYEKRTGCQVRERNEALLEWRFQRMADETNELGVTAVPLGEATKKVWEKMNEQLPKQDGTEERPIDIDGSTEPIEVDSDSDNDEQSDQGDRQNATNVRIDDDENDVTSGPGKEAESSKVKPFFRIVGAVDGVRDELYMAPAAPSTVETAASDPPTNASGTNDTNEADNLHNNARNEYDFSDEEEDQLVLRPIIVECKHRMKEAKVPPPLYDVIQTCLYCHMYNVEEADLIQVVRRRKSKSEEKENEAAKDNKGDGKMDATEKSKVKKEEDMKITITRVSLNDPIHNHSHHWTATLLPRISSFVDAVYNVRRDDGKRYRLLMALVQYQQEEGGTGAEREAWKVLWEECPWLVHCDTAFGRKKRF